ncbi:hypothetical protein WJX81_002305 [Elliptochloris bilobata]|uniref:Elongation factor P n=1 Tax=Elliptochloris bilobata TaxID=381761 RepID=A0AAW1S7C0_9CHLO
MHMRSLNCWQSMQMAMLQDCALSGSRRASLQIFALSSNDFRPGVCIELVGAPWKVVEFLHVKPGKGAAFVRTKLKNFITGNVVDKTFRGGESVDAATVEKKETQFSYVDGDDFVFMDTTTYDETRLKRDEDWAKYLKEGADVNLLFWKGRVIGVDPPMTVELAVTDTEPNVKGNTVSGGTKPATLETGATILVPLFISPGEKIKVDTRTNSYLNRASG